VNGNSESELQAYVKKNLPAADLELRRDLWPEVLRRMAASAEPMPWFDWVLLVAAAACLLFAPQMIPMLLYHL
jgi:hypothetical protein